MTLPVNAEEWADRADELILAAGAALAESNSYEAMSEEYRMRLIAQASAGATLAQACIARSALQMQAHEHERATSAIFSVIDRED